jgi:hypothetical protein
MKSIKTKPNSAKGPDKAKIVNKLYCILLTTLELTSIRFSEKRCYPTYFIFLHVSIIYLFSLNRILIELHRSFYYFSFFRTKIMNFMSFFFLKKYNQVNSSVVNNMQYFLFTIFPLSGPIKSCQYSMFYTNKMF